MLEKEVAIHSRILAWKIPRTEEAGGLQSMRSGSLTLLSTHIHNCFTMLCSFLLNSNMNQLYIYIYPLPLKPPSHCPRSSQSTKLRSLCYTAAFTSYFTQASVYMSVLFSIHPLSFPTPHTHEFILDICTSIPALQIGSSVLFF